MSVEPLPFVGIERQTRRLRAAIEARIGTVLDHGRFVMGPEIEELEEALASFVGEGESIAVSSGTDALQLALMAAGVGPGDAVFVPSFTFTATAEVVLVAGAAPVFVDVDSRTYNLDLASLETEIERVQSDSKLRPKAVIAVDLFGQPADYHRLEPLAKRHGLVVVADGAQSFGASLRGQRVGRLAPVSTTSFFPSKPLGGYGEGGAVFVLDQRLGAVVRSLRNHGQGSTPYEILRVGLNARLDSFQAAVLLVKLSVLEEELERREALAQHYDERFDGSSVLRPSRVPQSTSSWAQYTIQVDNRDLVRQRLSESGVPTAVHYPCPMHLQPAYREHGHGEGSLPVSESLCSRVLSLPMNPYFSDDEAERVCVSVLRAVKEPKGTKTVSVF